MLAILTEQYSAHCLYAFGLYSLRWPISWLGRLRWSLQRVPYARALGDPQWTNASHPAPIAQSEALSRTVVERLLFHLAARFQTCTRSPSYIRGARKDKNKQNSTHARRHTLSIISFKVSLVNTSFSMQKSLIRPSTALSPSASGPGVIVALTRDVFDPVVCLKETCIGKRVQVLSSTGKEISVMACRTELFPAL